MWRGIAPPVENAGQRKERRLLSGTRGGGGREEKQTKK